MTAKKNLGFTLVELMIAITIVAILATIGLTVYTNSQKSARDAKRRSDINAIANALEISRDQNSNLYPAQITANMFSGGTIPYDPLASGTNQINSYSCGTRSGSGYNSGCWYCYSTNYRGKGVTNSTYCSDPDGYIPDNNWDSMSGAALGNGPSSWIICANLENNPGYYCKTNNQ